MSIIVDEHTRVVVQGIGTQGTFHARRNQLYGTAVVAGVHPRRGGDTWKELDLPVFATAEEAVDRTDANTSMIMVPAPFTKDAILEAFHAGIRTIVTITEGVPVHDMTVVYDQVVRLGGARLIGPNCPGVISPGRCNVGIIPANIAGPGHVGLVSRSGTLTYQIMDELASGGLGISTCVGIGGDPVVGSDFLDVVRLFAEDPATRAIVLVGEIGGTDEQEAGGWIAEHIPDTPVVAYVAGFQAPPGKRMGHAGAIVREGTGGGETAVEKQQALEAFGIAVATNPSEAARLMIERLSTPPRSSGGVAPGG
ncbi:MAG TPA: succinate--CoA ligase subunit alpha [Nitriliruptorales bacterium]|nr:succinate--CoA ligase subunit alpha [Nitriliruptorales bacterium]